MLYLSKKIAVYILFFLPLIFFQNCMTFRVANTKVLKEFKEASIPIKIKEDIFNQKKYQYLEVFTEKNNDKPILLLVHGAPGSSYEFKHLLLDKEILKKADLISVDRLGYGNSGYGISEPSLEIQAKQLYHIANKYKGRKLIAIGHSYGGPIITKMAVEYPNDLDAVILLAPAIDPNLEKYEGIAKLGRWKLTKWLMSKAFQVAAIEKKHHVSELKKLENDLQKIKIPVLHCTWK